MQHLVIQRTLLGGKFARPLLRPTINVKGDRQRSPLFNSRINNLNKNVLSMKQVFLFI